MADMPDAEETTYPADHSAVTNELVHTLFQNVPLVMVPAILVTVLTIGLLYPHVATTTLALWCAAVVVTLLIRALIYMGYRQQSEESCNSRRWAHLYTAATFCAGVTWGLLPALFLDVGQPVVFIGLSVIVVGISAGMIGLYACWPPAFIAFTTPVLLLFSFSIMRFGESFVMIGAMGLVAYGTYLWLTLLSYSRLRRSVLMQFDNQELARSIGEEKERAEEANRAKSQLLAAISHDLRQPLQSIRLYTDLLQQKSNAPDLNDLCAKIEHSLGALTGMFNQLLDMTRMDGRSVDVELQRVELERLAERVYSQFILIADQKGIGLEVDCPDVWGWADPVLLGRVLDNLVTNALRYTEEGDVCVVFARVGGWIEIDVLDSGPGIPIAERQRVFEEFYQLHNESRQRSEGLGIGLAIVRRLCTLMDIGVEIMSTEGGGTRVRLRLPAVEPERTPAPEKPRPIDSDGLVGCHVMVVEDDPEVRIAMEETLASRGCQVSGYASGETALAGLDPANAPAVIVSDIRLPGNLDGHGVVKMLRERLGRAVPAVLITSGPDEVDVERSGCGAPEILLKPVHADELLAGVARCVERC